jgi:copper chaperone NosL
MMRRLLLVAVLLCVVGCQDKASTSAAAAASAVAIGDDECATCAMVVREQPAPRAQVVRRDGTRQMFCSIGDMLQSLQAPSPHGTAVATFVEVLDPEKDPSQTSAEPRPWALAQSASYVVGVPRKGVMGPPVLAYATRAQAEGVAKRRSGHTRDWDTLQKTLLSAAP